MKMKYLLGISLIIILGFTSCEGESTDDEDYYSEEYGDLGGDGNVSGSDWATGYWIKESGGTYLSIQSNTPEFCLNGSTFGVYSSINWVSNSVGYFTLYNNGDEVEFQISKSGGDLIISSWDATVQTTHNPSTYYTSNTYPCSVGGNGNGTGKISFYTMSDLGCGNITITVDGSVSKTITSHYPAGISNCNQAPTTTFTLSPGTHSYTAICNGYSWSLTNFTITDGGCLLYRLL